MAQAQTDSDSYLEHETPLTGMEHLNGTHGPAALELTDLRSYTHMRTGDTPPAGPLQDGKSPSRRPIRRRRCGYQTAAPCPCRSPWRDKEQQVVARVSAVSVPSAARAMDRRIPEYVTSGGDQEPWCTMEPRHAEGFDPQAPVAQGIEHRFPKPCAKVRILPGARLPGAQTQLRRSHKAVSDVQDPLGSGGAGQVESEKMKGMGHTQAPADPGSCLASSSLNGKSELWPAPRGRWRGPRSIVQRRSGCRRRRVVLAIDSRGGHRRFHGTLARQPPPGTDRKA